ncbi:MAG TPA: FxLYD domain-containing protein [Thermoanaerobaculia bacterium]|nr:FxLYD domain-containing protein [Thermoanaerobaculia bacterium]
MKRRRGIPADLVFLAALLGLAAGPARADWLVTRNGTWVETRGGWQVKGKLVVFHTLKGDLSSLRLSEVDLEASRRETARADLVRRAAEEARRRPPAKKAPILVLTDDKVRHAEPGGSAGPASPQSPPSLTVASWERGVDPQDGHVVITGTLRNVSGVQATDIAMSVQLLDADGLATATGQAVFTATVLSPGEQSGFRVEFPGASRYSDVKFEPRAVLAAAAPPPDGG